MTDIQGNTGPFKTTASLVSNYRFADGSVAFKVCRWEPKNGHDSKRILPYTWDGKEWVCKNLVPSGKRPLLNLPEIIEFEDARILIVQGEKKARAAEAMVPAGWVVTTWANGDKGLQATDLDPLKNRSCVIWPDNDASGIESAKELQKLLPQVRIIDIPLTFPPKWDLADPFPEGYDADWVVHQLESQRAVTIPNEEAEERAAILAFDAEPPPSDDGEEIIVDPKAPLAIARILVEKKYRVEGFNILQHQQGVFFKWVRTHYAELSKEQIRSTIYDFLEKCVQYNKPNKGGSLVPCKPNTDFVSNVLDAMRAVCQMSDDIKAPAWLEQKAINPPANEIIACRNGLLHLPTGNLLPHTPSFYSTTALAYAYDPKAPTPHNWLKFLEDLWKDEKTEEIDQEAIDTLRDIFGYLIGTDTDQQKLFLLVGPKRSGKGTIGRIINSLLGEDSVISPTLASLETNFGISPLIGKSAAIIGDARLGGRADQHAIAERLLSISGEDKQTVDRKFLPAWSGRIGTRFLIMTNELPRIADASGALASRFIILTLTRSFFGKEDRGLTKRLLNELPGILNWAISGWNNLRTRGFFIQPTSSSEAIQELEDLSSPISSFVRDRCVVAPGKTVGVDSLYADWLGWCKEQGRDHAGTKQTFGRDLRANVQGLKTSYPRLGDARSRMYEGITLKQSSDSVDENDVLWRSDGT